MAFLAAVTLAGRLPHRVVSRIRDSASWKIYEPEKNQNNTASASRT
jgi:hypothetical protein